MEEGRATPDVGGPNQLARSLERRKGKGEECVSLSFSEELSSLLLPLDVHFQFFQAYSTDSLALQGRAFDFLSQTPTRLCSERQAFTFSWFSQLSGAETAILGSSTPTSTGGHCKRTL